MLAATSAEIIERFDVLDESGRPANFDMLPGRQALRGEHPKPVTLHVRERSTGREWWTRVQASPVFDVDGRPELAINIWHDVTSERSQQDALRFLVQATSTLSETLDLDQTLRALADLLVPGLADWCGIDLLEAGVIRSVAVAHRDADKIALARVLRERYPPKLEAPRGVPNVLKTGVSELYPEVTNEMLVAGARDEEYLRLVRELSLRSIMIVPLNLRGKIFGAMTLVFAESARRYRADDLALAEELGRRAGIAIENARLYREAQKAIARRDDFLSVASHELRTPLMTLELHLTALLQYATDGRLAQLAPDKVIDRFQKARKQSQRLAQLASELLDVSRMADDRLVLQRERFDLVALAQELVDRFETAAAHAGSTLQLIASAPVVGEWDKGRVDQIMTNLVENALKYGARRPIELRLSTEGARAVIEVRDHGIGVASEDLDRIFQRFERTEAARNLGGLGLGLWIVRQICEAHGGTVDVTSQPNEGSTFTVYLPVGAEVP